jgi:hypothetical protein
MVLSAGTGTSWFPTAMMGRTAAELIDAPLSAVLHPDDGPVHQDGPGLSPGPAGTAEELTRLLAARPSAVTPAG